MCSEAVGKGFGSDLGERSVESVDELGGGSCKVGRFLGLVVLHDGKPVLDGGVVAGWG